MIPHDTAKCPYCTIMRIGSFDFTGHIIGMTEENALRLLRDHRIGFTILYRDGKRNNDPVSPDFNHVFIEVNNNHVVSAT